MKLDRNANGRGKYAIINLRKLDETRVAMATVDPQTTRNVLPQSLEVALATLQEYGLIEYGEPGTENEFFVIKLKDTYAGAALVAYADAVWRPENAASVDEVTYAEEVRALAKRAGRHSQWCKKPD